MASDLDDNKTAKTTKKVSFAQNVKFADFGAETTFSPKLEAKKPSLEKIELIQRSRSFKSSSFKNTSFQLPFIGLFALDGGNKLEQKKINSMLNLLDLEFEEQ